MPAAAGAALPAVRGPQPAALGSGIRCRRRVSQADPARAVHLRHDLQGDGGRAARRRHRRGSRSYGARFAGVVFPGETLKASIWKEGDGFHAVVTAPERDDAVALAGVELIPA